MNRPLLLVDVDGVISLFGFDPARPPDGNFLIVDGVAHFLSAEAAAHLLELCEWFEPAWCTGWEEKANEYLPHALGLPGPWPYLEFAGPAAAGSGHWKLEAVEAYAGRRPLAWVDDGHDERTRAWAQARGAPNAADLHRASDRPHAASRAPRWSSGLRACEAGPYGLAVTEKTGGSREATVDQDSPPSGDPNTSPEVAPK